MPKRRRSSSLPDVSNLKSPSPEEDSPTSSPPPLPPPPPPPHSTFFQMSSPTAMKVETPTGFLTLPQITSPSTGHYNPSLFFSGMQLSSTIASSPSHHNGIQQGDSHKEGDNPSTYPPSPPDDNPLHPVPIGRGPIQLWQFLLDLLLCSDKNHMIQWTGNGYEFRILQPEEIAKLWGARKNKPRMNYDKLSRGLRYYYSKGIMDKVPGKKLTFKYTCNIQQYMTQRGASSNSTTTTVSFAN